MIDLTARPFYLSPSDIAWVERVKASLSLEEKLEQLFFPLGASTEETYLQQEILSRHPGGILFRPGRAEDIRRANAFLQVNARVPMLIAANLEAGGNGAFTEGTVFGNQLQIAATGESEQAYRLGLVACREARSVGCNYAFAPVADIDLNFRNPITNVRTYGSDAEAVKRFCRDYLKAARECGTAVALKHFPGDGVDEVDQHILTSVNSLSCEEWDATFGMVYKALIEADALTVMAGHIAMPAYQEKLHPTTAKKLIPATLSPALLQGLLREKLGFNGMIITDSTVMVGFLSAMDREQAIPYCIEAGCDMILFNKDHAEDLEFLKKGYATGILSARRLEEAVTRILAAKAALRLHEPAAQELLSVVGCDQHQVWARECAHKAVTLVKDTQNLLPISPETHKRVLVQLMGGIYDDARVIARFTHNLETMGFSVTVWDSEGSCPGTVTEFRETYDLVMYLGNIVTASNKTTNRLNWKSPLNAPWFAASVPSMFISFQNPYHLLDVPMIKTYINAYSNHDAMIDAVVEKITGKSPFLGKSPTDPFCGKEYLSY